MMRDLDVDVDNNCLNSAFEIENALLKLKEITKEAERLKRLKKYRIESIDIEMKALTNSEQDIRELILNTMETHEPDEKTLNFPSIGKVTRRKTKGGWSIVDEAKLIEFIKEKGDDKGVVKSIEKLDTRKAKTLLDSYPASDVKENGAEFVKGGEGLTITFADSGGKMKAPPKKVSAPETHTDNIDELQALEL